MNARILTLAAVLAATATAAANAQSSSPWPQSGNVLDPEGVPLQRNRVVIDPEAGLPLYQRKFMPPQDSLEWLPDGARIVAMIKPPPLPNQELLEPVVMTFGKGGNINAHKLLFAKYSLLGTKVELRGPCYSACTIITSYVAKENLCIASGAFMAFHAARTSMDGPIDGGATIAMYNAFPPDIRQWIDRNGGVGKLPRDGYWTMYDRELWAIGYPRCK